MFASVLFSAISVAAPSPLAEGKVPKQQGPVWASTFTHRNFTQPAKRVVWIVEPASTVDRYFGYSCFEVQTQGPYVTVWLKDRLWLTPEKPIAVSVNVYRVEHSDFVEYRAFGRLVKGED